MLLSPFRRSNIYTQCEECRLSIDLTRAGGCRRCRRVLCNTHLYGSFFRRLVADFGVDVVCVRCRHEPQQEGAATGS